jgi:iron complex transport system ATP-binding protein
MLEINNLSCGYYKELVLRDIDLTINSGEIVGIIGPNGSGKTTLLRAITRLVKPRNGEIFFEGKNIWQMSFRKLAQTVAVVSQQIEPAPMKVEDFILLGRIPYYESFQFLETERDTDIAGRCMEITDTLQFKNRSMEEMSGGERQLVFIAKALAQEPKLLLLDEPTSHLDITHQVKILDLIKRLNKEFGLTVMMVLHDLNLASEYCQKIALFSEGRIYKLGAPQDVLQYQIIEDVYKTVVVVEKNPISKKPFVMIISEEWRQL